MSATVLEPSLRWDAALQAVQAAVAHAGELGIRINVAVVDRGGNTLAFLRMNGSFLHSADIATDKAYTAAGFGFPTGQWVSVMGDNEGMRLGFPQRHRLVVFGGGLPVLIDGNCVGGIGVSGGSEEQDEACAEAGLQAISMLGRR